MEETLELPVRPPRKFIPESFKLNSWTDAAPFFTELINRNVTSRADLEKWLKDWSEIAAVIDEEATWRYIRMTCNTRDSSLVQKYNEYISEIHPKLEPFYDRLNRKFIGHPLATGLPTETYGVYLRTVRNQVDLFREENIALNAEISRESQKYGQISAEMTITENGQEITLQQAAALLRDPDRAKRERIYFAIQDRRKKDRQTLDTLLSKLISLRDRLARNAGFSNYRDFRHQQLGRFDYSIQDCFSFHEAVAAEVVPVLAEFDREKKKKMGVPALKPWDSEFDPDGAAPLRPCKDSAELIGRTVECFRRIDPWFASRMEVMNAMGHFDLDSRVGKAPGGYQSTLYEIGVPFIFMNSANAQRDLVTMVHEGGHALHSFLFRDLELIELKNIPSEIAEVASMSMELISMEHWDVFYPDPSDLRRAKREQLEKVLRGLAWIARVDKFQHWLYENPTHDPSARTEYWMKTGKEFGTGEVDWSGMEEIAGRVWQQQLHIFEVPFYYIEYGIAQLGAVSIWRNYKLDRKKAIENYKKSLSLGYMRPLPELFQTAGIKFDFSRSHVRELTQFVIAEYQKL